MGAQGWLEVVDAGGWEGVFGMGIEMPARMGI
jgi:hypothetical protein